MGRTFFLYPVSSFCYLDYSRKEVGINCILRQKKKDYGTRKSLQAGEESLEELLATYRAEEEEMKVSDPRHPLPEPAKLRFFPWVDVLCSMLEAPDAIEVTEETCPLCGHKLLNIHFSSPCWTWNELCGRKGPMTICPACPSQNVFSLEVMS